MLIPEVRATSGRSSPSSQLAWWGSPQAIWTTFTPRSSSLALSSAMQETCKLQLQTPRARGGIGSVAGMGAAPSWKRGRSSEEGRDRLAGGDRQGAAERVVHLGGR